MVSAGYIPNRIFYTNMQQYACGAYEQHICVGTNTCHSDDAIFESLNSI